MDSALDKPALDKPALDNPIMWSSFCKVTVVADG